MSYMSYCKFEGTKHELAICLDDVMEHINEEAQYEVSDHEIEHFKQMIYVFVEFLQETEIIDEYGDIDENNLETVCEKMKKGYEEEGEY